MSFNFGISTGALQRVMAGWAQATRQLQECPTPVPASAENVPATKAYESGLLLHSDLRLVDVPVSPVRLPADFWRRAIEREHAA
jgi:hypothetical protein